MTLRENLPEQKRWTESTESLSAPARAESSSRYAKGEF